MLEELLFQYDFIAPEQIRKNALDSYKVLVLPHIEALSDADVRLIKDFIGKGGTVVTDILPGAYDELGVKRKEPPFAADKLVVFDKTFDDKDTAQRARMLQLLEAAKAEPVARCDDQVGTYGREAMRFVKGGMNVYAITRNFTRSDDAKTQTFTFPGEGHLYDLREGKYLGKTNQATCAIPNADTKVYGLYPYQVTGLDVTVPDTVQGGKDLKAEIAVRASTGESGGLFGLFSSDSATPGHHVFHIEVVPPSGEARWFMKRNVAAPGGKLNFVFRMAANDPKGEWTLRVTDVMTGTTNTKKFTLR